MVPTVEKGSMQKARNCAVLSGYLPIFVLIESPKHSLGDHCIIKHSQNP